MHGDIAHVAINADDTATARSFYEALFGWSFADYAPGFARASLPGGGIAALQQRRALLPGGAATTGLEVTFEADDVDAVAAAVVSHGGRVLMEKTAIPG